SNISRLERGSSNPGWKTLQRYAHACGFELTVHVEQQKQPAH
ncbi:MAG: helix-turn-helix transcriptional regulator, partial [Pseudomonadota bacterium]|nr:helix-turn-helix transcriptional regulator [Pseudomonadota bacterium]